jgi:hypothetical protein
MSTNEDRFAKHLTYMGSLKNHQINGKGIIGFGIPVTLTGSHNPYLTYPVAGVLVILEQGMDLSIIDAVFHVSKPDGSLGAPCVVRNPTFTHG